MERWQIKKKQKKKSQTIELSGRVTFLEFLNRNEQSFGNVHFAVQQSIAMHAAGCSCNFACRLLGGFYLRCNSFVTSVHGPVQKMCCCAMPACIQFVDTLPCEMMLYSHAIDISLENMLPIPLVSHIFSKTLGKVSLLRNFFDVCQNIYS